MEPQPVAHNRRLLGIAVVVAVAVVLIGTVVWVEEIVLAPKPGPPVELLGINRTVTYNGSHQGYVSGTIASGCPVCPLVIDAGTTVVVNVSWLTTDPLSSHLNYTFVNATIRSSYPFLAVAWSGNSRPTVYSFDEMYEFGGPGGSDGIRLSIDIPFDSSGLPPTGYINEWVNASAY